jgi:hypothetical protein
MVNDIRLRNPDAAAAPADAEAAPRGRHENGMDEYERITEEWNQRAEIEERRDQRGAAINNTAGYHHGNRVHHLRAIQMYSHPDWNALFGRETLDPLLRRYAQASIDYSQDETQTVPFAGQMEVSLLTQENYRPGVHVFTFFIHLSPHRAFHDGHMIQMEVGDGSNTHLTINRLFNTNTRAVVLQATQYQLLEFLANDDDAMELLHGSFLDDEFYTTRFSYIADENDPDGRGEYIVNPYANDDHEWHDCAGERNAVAPVAAIPPPPPPPVDDFDEIYQRNYGGGGYDYDYDYDDDDDGGDGDGLVIRNNIIQYNYNNVEARLPAQG